MKGTFLRGDDTLNLEETVTKCQLGDSEAFRELFNHMEQKAFGTAYLIAGKRGLAEDIVQEAFVCCIEQIKTLRSPEAFNVWFYRMITRIGWKMVKNHEKLVPDDILSKESITQYSTEEEVQVEMMNQSVINAVDGLSNNLKTVVILHYFNGMSIEEISKVTGSLRATVKTRLYYARNVLRKKLENALDESRESFMEGRNIKKASYYR